MHGPTQPSRAKKSLCRSRNLIRGPRPLLRLALLLLLMIAVAASADQLRPAEPGLTYRVLNVSPSDVLNVRSQAAASAPIIGSLRSDVTGIIVTGVSQSVSDSTWWQIVQPTGNKAIGWVNARFLIPADSGAEPKTDFGLRCTGTEPFWSLEVAEGSARFEAPEGDRPSWKASRWRDAGGHRPGHRFVIELGTESAHAVGWAAISRPQQFCTDGMSDLRYPYELIVMTPTGRVLAGCCARAP
jgi:uncharacterized membrane protein